MIADIGKRWFQMRPNISRQAHRAVDFVCSLTRPAKSSNGAPVSNVIGAEPFFHDLDPARFGFVPPRIARIVKTGCEGNEAEILLQQRIAEITVNKLGQTGISAG